jgi:hypothetical protein
MGKGAQENKMLIPPDGGEWILGMKSGRAYKGILLARYDNAVIIEPEKDVVQVVMIAEIETMWQGPEEPVKAPEE